MRGAREELTYTISHNPRGSLNAVKIALLVALGFRVSMVVACLANKFVMGPLSLATK